MSLVFASIFTLGILFAFVLGIISAILSFFGIVKIWILISITAAIFFLQWLISPYLSDLVFRWFYKLRWINIEGLEILDKEVSNFVKETCKKNKIKIPKIGFIDDDNPQAFCYGSAAFNARVVVTKGIFTYLNTEERKAVLGHEFGHIVHRDFIIMSLAAFLIAFLYHLFRFLVGSRSSKGRSDVLVLVGVVAYILYWIGTYLLLFLSRIREYFADEFSVKATDNSDAMASALIKIAYGIIARPDEEKQLDLMYATRTLGILDFKAAKGIGLTYLLCVKLKSWEPIQKAFLFDLKNPWAFIYEINSSHPLVAKRIRRIEKIKDVKAFDFNEIEKKYYIDNKKLYANFFKDMFFEFLPIALFLCFFLVMILYSLKVFIIPFELFFSLFFICLGMSIVGKTIYRYPSKPPEKTTILELMEDVYASPIRGKPVELEGRIVGRGIPGLIFSEDMMFQDKTGLIYLNYEGLIPFFSNLVFAIFKIQKFVGKDVKAYGWFIRGLRGRLELKSLYIEGKEVKSWVKFLGIAASIPLFLIGLMILALFLLILLTY